jgi:O-acetyl-ADP-ribose deacetylase (regulator of RNase III)
MMKAIKTREGFLGTIEFFPEQGKYHYDGHRNCGVSLTPKETIRNDYLCPACGRKVTVGVMHRVEKLADRAEGFEPAEAPSFSSIIPLPEIIAEGLECGVNTKKVNALYLPMLEQLGSEFRILLDAPLDDIERASSRLIREAVARMRAGNVHIAPGYDGEYGKVKIFEDRERKRSRHGKATSVAALLWASTPGLPSIRRRFMDATEKKINNTTIRLVSADLTERDVDAIVNAANSRLQHGGGVAGAIVRKGGRIIQDESDKIGSVPVGNAAITTAGTLKARAVIHAVGPRMGEGDEDNKLKKAINSVLALAAEKKLRSISIPAISAGIFGFPKDRCAKILVGETAAFLKGNPGAGLELVEFCIFDKEAFEFFRSQMETAEIS